MYLQLDIFLKNTVIGICVLYTLDDLSQKEGVSIDGCPLFFTYE